MSESNKELIVKFDPRDWQKEVIKELKRFNVFVIHRQAGKTVLAVAITIQKLLSCKRHRPQVAYIGPNYGLVKRAAWDYFKDMLEPFVDAGLVTFNESALRIDFKPFNNNGGAKIYLFGSEDPDSLRGLRLDFAVLDEYADMPSHLFSSIIMPTLSSRQGSVLIMGTPKGKNSFYEMYKKAQVDPNWVSIYKRWQDTKTHTEDEIEIQRSAMTDEEFEREFECSFEASIKGSFFGKNLARLEKEGRVKDILHDPCAPVVVGWDLGFDGTSMWFLQKQKDNFVVLDVEYYSDEDLTHGVNIVKNKPYTYAYQLLPHDGNDRNIVDKTKTPKGLLESLGLKTKIVKRISLITSINSGRLLLDKCYIAQKCADKIIKLKGKNIKAIDALKLYKAKESDGIVTASEEHDEFSHLGSAWRTLAEGVKEKRLDNSRLETAFGVKQQLKVESDWNPFKR